MVRARCCHACRCGGVPCHLCVVFVLSLRHVVVTRMLGVHMDCCCCLRCCSLTLVFPSPIVVAAMLAQFGGDFPKMLQAMQGRMIANTDPMQHPAFMMPAGAAAGGAGSDDSVDGKVASAAPLNTHSKRPRKRRFPDAAFVGEDDEDVDVDVDTAPKRAQSAPRARATVVAVGGKVAATAPKPRSKKRDQGDASVYSKKYSNKNRRRAGSDGGDDHAVGSPAAGGGHGLDTGLMLPDHVQSGYHGRYFGDELGFGSPSGAGHMNSPFDMHSDFMSPSQMGMGLMSPSFTNPPSVSGAPLSTNGKGDGRAPRRLMYDPASGMYLPPGPGSVMSLPGLGDIDMLSVMMSPGAGRVAKDGGLGSVPMPPLSGVSAEEAEHFRAYMAGAWLLVCCSFGPRCCYCCCCGDASIAKFTLDLPCCVYRRCVRLHAASNAVTFGRASARADAHDRQHHVPHCCG